MSAPDDSNSSRDPFANLRGELHRRHKSERLTEVRSARFNPKETDRIDHMADTLHLDASTLIRLILNGELSADGGHPEMSLLRAALERCRRLARQHEVEA